MSARVLVGRLALLAAAALGGGCKVQQSWTAPEPGLERMMTQPRVDPFAESAFFDDGRAMRKPPKDTVALESTVGDRWVVDGLVDGVYATEIPIPVTRALLDAGRAKFDIVCATCHGVAGDGESVVAENMALRRPPSLHEERLRALADGRIYQVIRTGYGLMPPFAAQLGVEERWAIVAYVRALQLSQGVDVARLPPAMRAELEEASR